MTAAAGFLVLFAGPAAADLDTFPIPGKFAPPTGGTADFRDQNYGHYITECPQAGLKGDANTPRPLDRRERDEAERRSDGGDDRRTNIEFSCFPQNETSIDVNPRNTRNIVTAQNDYRLGWGTSGINASSDNGHSWYTLIAPFPSLPSGDNLDGGGDPALTFDRAGVVYYAEINFNRTDDTNGIWVLRSTNGGFTWTRPCVAIDTTPGDPTDDAAACGGIGDPRQPGDGTVSFFQDNDFLLNGSVPFDDKEYIASGPRPAGIGPVCFAPITHTPRACDPAVVGVDRVYVTWTRFTDVDANIMVSWSDDQGRSWSPARAVSGSAPFCAFGAGSNCDFNQFSTPTVHPETGLLGIAFENFNTPDENQFLFVRSRDGGSTFEGPFFVTPVFDVNFPRAGAAGGRPDCTARGQQGGRIVYTNSCFRSNAGGNVQVDKRGGAFADDFYLVMSDNRNGTRASSNADVFLFKSIDGGSTWIGPTRVNSDRSALGVPRTCTVPRPPPAPPRPTDHPGCLGDFGADQWWPWVDVSERGELVVTFKDRRLDRDSTLHEWPASRQRPGNYLVWTWGANCDVDRSAASECMAAGATTIPQPAAPIDPGADPVPGQGPTFLGPFDNFGVSDVPSNFDYSFRAGIFAGDYDVVTVEDDRAYAHFTDARNGRSSGNPTSPAGAQPGRNPACEQSDVFYDSWGASGRAQGQNNPSRSDSLFLVTACPKDMQDHRDDDDDDDDDD
jgi:hypothetical protein